MPDPAIPAPPIDRTRYRLPPSQFFALPVPKDLIVLHFTAGANASGAYQSWLTTGVRVAAPYLVEAGGAIFEIFDPRCWAYHLGISGPASQNHAHDKRSIAIEIVNWGPLKLSGADLCAWPAEYSRKVADLNKRTQFVQRPYRGFDYYAAFPAAQMKAVVALVQHLCRAFSIPARLPDPGKRTLCDLNYFSTFTGVATHQNFRPDKFDVGPAFDWAALGF